MAVPAQTFWKGLRGGICAHAWIFPGKAVVTSHNTHANVTLLGYQPLGKKTKWCHLKLVKTKSRCDHRLKTVQIGQHWEREANTKSAAHQITPWVTTGREKWGFVTALHGVSPCPIGRGEVTSPTYWWPTVPVTCIFSWLQAAPISQSSHWERPLLWLRVVRAEGFKRWQMMKMEKVGRNWAESLADVRCCISRWPMPGFSGKGLRYGNTIPVFPHRTVLFFFSIYWILRISSFHVKTHELYCKRLEIKHSHAKRYSLKCLVYSWFHLPDAFPDITVPSPVTLVCVRGPFLSMSCSARSSSTSCWIWRKRRVLRNRGTCCQKRGGLSDCLNSHWTEEQGGPMYPSNLQIARNMLKLNFEMS